MAIANDLTLRQRQDVQKLKTFLQEARSKYSERSYLKGNKLIIGEKSYTLEELERSTEKTLKTNSAPNTPSRNCGNDDWKMDEEQNTVIGEEKTEETRTQEKNRKVHNTPPHLATHKRVFSNKSRSPPKTKSTGRKLRQKDTSDRKN